VPDPLEGGATGLNLGLTTMAGLMAEATLQEHVRSLCKALGVLHQHQHNSRRSEPGWPDSFMVGPGGILVYELKVESLTRGKVSPDQRVWIAALRAQGLTVHVRRPSHWYAGIIEQEIRAIAGRRKAP
jgi:hypothetical protein